MRFFYRFIVPSNGSGSQWIGSLVQFLDHEGIVSMWFGRAVINIALTVF